MNPAVYNIVINQRATFSKTFQFKGSDNTPLNMTGYTVEAEVWTRNKTKKLADFSVTWVDRLIGKFTISLSPQQTALIQSEGYWDMLITEPSGKKDYWLRGRAGFALGYTE
jgi:hypothetical protein